LRELWNLDFGPFHGVLFIYCSWSTAPELWSLGETPKFID